MAHRTNFQATVVSVFCETVASLDLERFLGQDETIVSYFAVLLFLGKHHYAAVSIGTEQHGAITPSTTPTPSTWKEKELLIKIDGEIKARNPNLEVHTNINHFGASTARGGACTTMYYVSTAQST